MAQLATFRVLVPAQNPNGRGNGVPTPDPQDVYVGPAAPVPHKGAQQIGQAMVFGGVEAGGAVRGCTYMTPQFRIPGFGEITFQ